MRLCSRIAAGVLLFAALSSSAMATSSKDILAKVKTAEASLRDFKADMFITQGNKSTVSGMGEGYGDVLMMEKGTVAYKKPDKIRFDGYTHSMKAAYIQNGYTKLVLASMVRHRENVKNAPGKRQDSLDMGFISSRLWTDNDVTVLSTGRDGIVKMKLHPKFGGDEKRHDLVWLDPATLKVVKREKYRGSGEMRVRMVYSDFEKLTSKLPIATQSTMYDPQGRKLGTVVYKNLKVNQGLPDSLFSLSSR